MTTTSDAKISAMANEVMLSQNFVKEYESFSQEERARITKSIELLESMGRTLKYLHNEKVRDNLWVLRYTSQRKKFRIFYFSPGKSEFVLLHVYVKKSNKIEARHIDTALRRMYQSDSTLSARALNQYLHT